MLCVKQEEWEKYHPKNWNDLIKTFTPLPDPPHRGGGKIVH